MLLAEQVGTEEAAERLNVSPRSIRRWRQDPELADLVLKTREETADDVKVAMVLSWELIIERLKAGEISTKDLIVLGGVAFDKHQLATGGATSRTEARDITGTLSDGDIIAAIREADRLAGGEGAAETAPGEAQG